MTTAKFSLKAAIASNKGLLRDHNEDNFLFFNSTLPDLFAPFHADGSVTDLPALFALFDGIGGAKSGEIASHIAASTIMSANPKSEKSLLAALESANSAIFTYATQNNIKSMGTTFVSALITTETVSIVNLGDSPAYSFNGKTLKKLSSDHIYPTANSRKGGLIGYLGAPAEDLAFEPSSVSLKPSKVKKLLLCSDGLTDLVDESKIAKILASESAESAAKSLESAALSAGGTDNITVIVIDFISKKRYNLFSKRAESI